MSLFRITTVTEKTKLEFRRSLLFFVLEKREEDTN